MSANSATVLVSIYRFFWRQMRETILTSRKTQILIYFGLNSSSSSFIFFFAFVLFLAHLSRRLTGELIVYPWCGVRRRPSVVRPSFTMLKHLLLRNRLAYQSQILCGASLGRGNKILFAASGSHDQDGRHAHIW